MKSITIAGNVTRDAELRTAGNDKVLGFSVAVSEGFGDKKRTLFFDCSIWGKRAETLSSMITKGGKVAVTGDLSTREHNGKTYLTVNNVGQVTLMSGKQDGERRDDSGGQGGDAGYGQASSESGYGAGGSSDMDDEIPF